VIIDEHIAIPLNVLEIVIGDGGLLMIVSDLYSDCLDRYCMRVAITCYALRGPNV
jgi:hypothetical protein